MLAAATHSAPGVFGGELERANPVCRWPMKYADMVAILQTALLRCRTVILLGSIIVAYLLFNSGSTWAQSCEGRLSGLWIVRTVGASAFTCDLTQCTFSDCVCNTTTGTTPIAPGSGITHPIVSGICHQGNTLFGLESHPEGFVSTFTGTVGSSGRPGILDDVVEFQQVTQVTVSVLTQTTTVSGNGIVVAPGLFGFPWGVEGSWQRHDEYINSADRCLSGPFQTCTSHGGFDTIISAARELVVVLMTDPDKVWANGHEETELTALVTGADGQAIPGRRIRLSHDAPDGVIIEPGPEESTIANEGAIFKVRSTKTGTVTFTATDVETGRTDSKQVQFIQRRVVVFVQGINTSLNTSLKANRNTEERTFPEIRDLLINNGFSRPSKGNRETGVKCANVLDDDGDRVPNDGCPLILNYSYLGGEVDSATGIWRPKAYSERHTSRRLFPDSILSLNNDLILEFARNNPNTRFVIIGHSQGGLIALHGLDLVTNQDIAIDAVITLDGALGGASRRNTLVAALATLWGDPAASDMVAVWRNATDKRRLGTTALGNRELVEFARSRGTKVLTLGNRDDCIWNTRNCGISGRNGSSTQINEAADVHKRFRLGGNCDVRDIRLRPERVFCILNSHGMILKLKKHRIPNVRRLIEEFAGLPTVP